MVVFFFLLKLGPVATGLWEMGIEVYEVMKTACPASFCPCIALVLCVLALCCLRLPAPPPPSPSLPS